MPPGWLGELIDEQEHRRHRAQEKLLSLGLSRTDLQVLAASEEDPARFRRVVRRWKQKLATLPRMPHTPRS